MKSQIFTYGGGAGVGSYVIVLNNGSLQEPNAEKIRWSYDSGESLFLSIIDDTTEEALLPLTGYVDNENVLHLIGRDFDDNKTYEFVIDNTTQSVEATEIDGVTLGDGIISTEGGGSGTEVIPNPEIEPGEQLEELNSIQIGDNKYTIGSGGDASKSNYYELRFGLRSLESGLDSYDAIFYITEENIDLIVNEINQGFEQMQLPYTVTKETWSSVLNPLLANADQQFYIQFSKIASHVLELSINHVCGDYDGLGSNIYINALGGIVINDVNGQLFPYNTTLTLLPPEYNYGSGSSASAGGSAGGVDTIVMTTTVGSAQIGLDLVFNSNAGELEKHKDELNTGIQAINTQAGTSIPLMTDLDSLSDILDYLNTLNQDVIYNNAMNGFFTWLSYYCIGSGVRFNTNNSSNYNRGFLHTDIQISTAEGYVVSTLGRDENYVTLDGGGSGSINGTADGEDGSSNPISLSVNGTADVSVSVSGNIPAAGENIWASASQNTKFSSLTVVKGSSQGGSVEAEPIISINMTNMDVTGINEEVQSLRTIRDLQFYCTKERWDNFVALSKQQFQVDVTYDNFGSLFMGLDVSKQAMTLGYLLMDYYNGKILPEAYLQDSASSGFKSKYGISDIKTFTLPQMQIEIAVICQFGTETDGVIPSVDVTNTNYYTADTVATVKEIAGPAIGSSSSSGTTTTQIKSKIIKLSYKTTKTGLENGSEDTYDCDTTYTFIKKVNQQQEQEFINLAKQQNPSISTLEEAVQLYETIVSQDISSLAFLAYEFSFDEVKEEYYEYNHTISSDNMAEPWVAKGPLFCYMNVGYVYKMAMVNELGLLAPINLQSGGTFTHTITEEVEAEITIPSGSGGGDTPSQNADEINYFRWHSAETQDIWLNIPIPKYAEQRLFSEANALLTQQGLPANISSLQDIVDLYDTMWEDSTYKYAVFSIVLMIIVYGTGYTQMLSYYDDQDGYAKPCDFTTTHIPEQQFIQTFTFTILGRANTITWDIFQDSKHNLTIFTKNN